MKRSSVPLPSTMATLIAGLGLLLALLVALSAFVYREQDQYNEARRLSDANRLLAAVLSDLQDAETGQRGFLLTGDRQYLAPYERALAVVEDDFAELSKITGNYAGAQRDVRALHDLAQQKLVELRTTIDLRKAGKTDEALALVNGGSGKALMDQIRALTSKLLVPYNVQLDARYAAVEHTGLLLRFAALIEVLGLLGLGGILIRQLRGQVRDLTNARDELSALNLQLLNEAQQREKISAQLRQSQKMEAVGQLTGGLAHDFNNMLAVVTGNLDLAKRRLLANKPDVGRFLDGALDGAERAATLTQRLLAFSRQQPLSPVSIDANKMVSGMSELLRRSLGEGVRLETVLGGGVWRTHADPNQLESTLLNLAVNARDAMPDGAGKLTIETSNAYLDDVYASQHIGIKAGQYVLIAVTDTGAGMSEAVLEKAFDPFFTTKGVGKGTGLGLSQVHGFVRQSEGHVKIYSEEGQGTTVKIYLPRFYGEDEAQAERPSTGAPSGRSDELVLVVEDDDRVRQVTVDAVRELGYQVVHADGATAALRQLDANPRIGLLFTDIVMPDVNGRKLSEEALRRRPGLRILYTTGFTRNAVVHNGVLDRDVDLIVKPYSVDQLARKLREVLDRV